MSVPDCELDRTETLVLCEECGTLRVADHPCETCRIQARIEAAENQKERS